MKNKIPYLLNCFLYFEGDIPIGNEPEHVKQAVGAPEGYEFTCFLAIGYAAENARLPKQKEIRIEDRIHQNIW